MVALLAEQTDLVRLPRSIGTYRGAHLTWDLYTLATHVPDAGPDLYRLNMGVAHVEQDARYYLVVLITLPMEYELTFLTRLVTHLAAPGFFLLMGVLMQRSLTPRWGIGGTARDRTGQLSGRHLG